MITVQLSTLTKLLSLQKTEASIYKGTSTTSTIQSGRDIHETTRQVMKIAHHNGIPPDQALTSLLQNYRSTPHPATGISLSSMLFRNGQRTAFPRTTVSEQDVTNTRTRDRALKQQREGEINSSKYRKSSQLRIGDMVLLRNYHKTSKFQPTFLPVECIITNYNS